MSPPAGQSGSKQKLGGIEFAMWANEQAVIASALICLGGILSVASLAEAHDIYYHERWPIGAYAIGISVVIFFLEYPRSKRRKGRVQQRRGQHILTACVKGLGPFGRNYVFRFIFYMLAGIPCLFQLGTVMGGLSLVVAALIYFVAAIGGETWMPCEKEVPREKRLTRAGPPTSAPPRLQPSNGKNDVHLLVVENKNAMLNA